MRVSCLQENLAKGLSVVGRAVATRSTLPVLSNVMLSTDSGRLKLSATDLEIGINCWIGAKVEEDGATTVPARLLMDFVNSLPTTVYRSMAPADASPGLREIRYTAVISMLCATRQAIRPHMSSSEQAFTE